MKSIRWVRKYNIRCDFDLNARVQKFAGRHSVERTVIEVRSRKRLFKADPRVTVTFKTNFGSRTSIYKSFIEEFKDYDLKIKGTRLSVYKQKEGS